MNKAQRQRAKPTKESQEESLVSGTKVYELAKEYNLTNKELIALLEEHGVRVKNAMSTLDPDTVALIESELADEPVEETVFLRLKPPLKTPQRQKKLLPALICRLWKVRPSLTSQQRWRCNLPP